MSRKNIRVYGGIILIVLIAFSFFAKKQASDIKNSCGFNDFTEEMTISKSKNDDFKIVIDGKKIKMFTIEKNAAFLNLIYDNCLVEDILSLDNKGESYIILKERGVQRGLTVGNVRFSEESEILFKEVFTNEYGDTITSWDATDKFDVNKVNISYN